MKSKILYILLAIPFHTLAQSSARNYVVTEKMLNASGDSVISSVQYCDGLGRPDILATNGLNPEGETAYTLTEYDLSGQAVRIWLPAVAESNGLDWKTPHDIKILSKATNNDEAPYSITKRDVLDREVSVYGAGSRWHSAKKDIHTMRYICRDKGNTDRIAKRYKAPIVGEDLQEDGVWEEGSLGIEAISDEDGNTVMVFTDFLGRKILERRIADTYNDTYYVYNDYGQLRFVLSPMYQEEDDLNKYAYEYRYDKRSRCNYKRLPGCQPVRYWYDDSGRQVFVQDGELQKKSRCRFMLYDAVGRLAVSGTCSNTPQDCQQATAVHTASGGICGTGYQCGGDLVLSSPELETAYYYDNYNFFADSAFSYNRRLPEMTKTDYSNATSLQTGSIVRATDGALTCTVCYYNEKGQVCDWRQSLPGGRLLLMRTGYSFTGKVVRTVCELRQENRTDSVVTENRYRNDILVATSIACNGGAARQVSCLGYDGLGRMVRNTLPGDCGSIAYSYDVRDEITCIQGRHYTEHIDYEGLYNGNIASIENTYASNAGTNKYDFTYDNLNRMVRAATSGSNAYTEELSYDQNGNIQSLKRWGRHNDGTYKMIDALTYNYNGNQIRNIVDNAGQLVYDGSFDFKSSGSSLPYAFNGNGAMTYDPDKGLTIDYADTGMPLRMVFDSGNATEYVYGADGTELKVSWMSRLAQCRRTDRWDDEEDFIGYFPGDGDGGGSQGGETGGTGSLATIGTQEYAGPFIINDGELSMFLFDGGYCTFDGSQPQFHYYIKDHLGSNRIVMAENGQVEQKNCYYPFGGVYGDVSTNTDLQPYKYNGKELDRMHGRDTYDYGARMYDPILCRWDRMDPMCEKYYGISPYVYCMNNPVKYIDPDGRFITYQSGNRSFIYFSGNFYVNKSRRDGNGKMIITGAIVQPSSTHMKRTLNALRKMDNSKDPYIKKVFDTVSDLNSDYEHVIRTTREKSHTKAYDSERSDVFINYEMVNNYKDYSDFKDVGLTDYELVGHELKHSYNMQFYETKEKVDNESKIKLEEIETVNFENLIRKEEGMLMRTMYGVDIPNSYLISGKITIWNLKR